MSVNRDTPTESPSTPVSVTRTLQPKLEDRHDFSSRGQLSRDSYKNESPFNPNVSRATPLMASPNPVYFGTEPISTTGDAWEEEGSSSHHRAPAGAVPEPPAGPSSHVPSGFPQRRAISHGSLEGAAAGLYDQGQPNYGSLPHHPHYPQGPAYVVPYPGHGQPMGPYRSPPPLTYREYYHPISPPPQPQPQPQPQRHSYSSRSPDGPSQSHAVYHTTPLYSPHGFQASQGSSHTPFATGGAYPQYSSFPQYAHQQSSYHPGTYPQQYGNEPYPQYFGPSPDREQQGTWWFVAGQSPQPYETSHHSRPAFQRLYSYPLQSSLSNPGPGPPSHSSASDIPSLQAGLASLSSSNPRAATARHHGTVPSSPSSASGTRASPLDGDGKDAGGSTETPTVRRPYHPKAPTQRSGWTMWVGNVPTDATQDELWHFFSQLPSVSRASPQPVVSVFLINRSSCAFINYDTEAHLDEAINHFNGKALRPGNDSKFPKLVCRVRKKDDELKAGVGGQRGTGLHTKWVKKQKAKEQPTAPPDPGEGSSTGSLVASDDERRRRRNPKQSSSSGSYGSTTSSLLARYFPRRFFILKSLTQHDLDLSVEKGLWATQKHNEVILDQAYRTSREVILIFGVNKSGEFYGYARMTGPIQSEAQPVAWEARRRETPSSLGARSPTMHSSAPDSRAEDKDPPLLLSPSAHRLVDRSPISTLPESPADSDDTFKKGPAFVQTAPPAFGPRDQLSVDVPQAHHTFEGVPRRLPPLPSMLETVSLDHNAPQAAMRKKDISAEMPDGPEEAKVDEQETPHSWGQSFKVEWLCTERLPFYRLKHIRNPWNHDKEVKVSRDGTELEPTVGQKLIEEWHTLATEEDPAPRPTSGKARSMSKKPRDQ